MPTAISSTSLSPDSPNTASSIASMNGSSDNQSLFDIPPATGAAPSAADSTSAVAAPTLPPFLRQSKAEIGKLFFDLEWKQRHRLAQGMRDTSPSSQWARVSGDEVVKRNRYMNVDPFLNNRVRLKVPEGVNDYINASPIVLQSTKSGTKRKFIATQGPKEDAHIWHMIYHETPPDSPAVIVMLTQIHESGKEKCFQYYPHSMDAPTMVLNEHDEFGDGFVATLTLVSLTADETTRSEIRELELKVKDGPPRKVWHLLFAGWPDFLIPEDEDRAALIELVRLSAAKNKNSDVARVVHCSAGVGRSGTFIALDWLLGELEEGALDEGEVLKNDAKDPIAEVVDELRQQRMMMVQGEAQFQFLYDVVKNLWTERWNAKHK